MKKIKLIICSVFLLIANINAANYTVNSSHYYFSSCVVPRAVPIVESMFALTLIDHYLRGLINKI